MRLIAAAALVAGLAACAGGGSPAPAPTTHAASAPSSSPSARPPRPPPLVAVTNRGALVTLNPVTGTVRQTLVPAGVLGDEISVSAQGFVYFAVNHGCSSTIEVVPMTGGTPAVLTQGSLPAVSPDGMKLAYADQPKLTVGCAAATPNPVPLYHLDIRTLSSGATDSLPMLPAGQDTGLPAPISHLSWDTDNDHLAVSIAEIQDNEGWTVLIADTGTARSYLTGTGITPVPVRGSTKDRQYYLREGVYMPNGDLFVSRACCAGFPVRNTSRLMWEITTSGAFVHQVAIGYTYLDHKSLDVSANGKWLLYLAGHDLYISQGGATPHKVTSGLIAAAWG